MEKRGGAPYRLCRSTDWIKHSYIRCYQSVIDLARLRLGRVANMTPRAGAAA